MRLLAGFVPGFARLDRRVVIGFGVVGRVITGFAQERRKSFEPRWNFSLRAHVLGGAMCDGIHPADEREPRRRTDGLGEAALVEDAAGGEFVERWRSSQRIAVTAEIDVVVFADEPKDVGMLSGS